MTAPPAFAIKLAPYRALNDALRDLDPDGLEAAVGGFPYPDQTATAMMRLLLEGPQRAVVDEPRRIDCLQRLLRLGAQPLTPWQAAPPPLYLAVARSNEARDCLARAAPTDALQLVNEQRWLRNAHPLAIANDPMLHLRRPAALHALFWDSVVDATVILAKLQAYNAPEAAYTHRSAPDAPTLLARAVTHPSAQPSEETFAPLVRWLIEAGSDVDAPFKLALNAPTLLTPVEIWLRRTAAPGGRSPVGDLLTAAHARISERRLALAMALQPRLGQGSLLALLDASILATFIAPACYRLQAGVI